MARRMGKDMAAFIGLALDHSSKTVREEAMRAIRYLGAEAEAQILEGTTKKTRFPTMKIKAFARLSTLRGGEISPQLRAIINDQDARPHLKIEAVHLLGNIRAMDAKTDLVGTLLAPNEQLRIAAAVALLKLHR